MKERESTVEKNFKDHAEKLGFEVRKFTSPGHKNVPDRFLTHECCGPCLVELKRPGAEPTPAQLREHKRLREAGCKVYWIDNSPDAIKFLDTIIKYQELP